MLGGSTLCKLAFLNGLKGSTKEAQNCLWARPDDPGEVQIKEFMESDFQFLSLEYRPLPDDDEDLPLPGDVQYILTLRHPLNRILSHFRHTQIELKKLLDNTFPELVTFPVPFYWWTSNYYLKMLGCCDKDPYYECTRADLEKAKRRLEYFSMIWITDDPNTSNLSSKFLDRRFGWKVHDVSTSCFCVQGGRNSKLNLFPLYFPFSG